MGGLVRQPRDISLDAEAVDRAPNDIVDDEGRDIGQSTKAQVPVDLGMDVPYRIIRPARVRGIRNQQIGHPGGRLSQKADGIVPVIVWVQKWRRNVRGTGAAFMEVVAVKPNSHIVRWLGEQLNPPGNIVGVIEAANDIAIMLE